MIAWWWLIPTAIAAFALGAWLYAPSTTAIVNLDPTVDEGD